MPTDENLTKVLLVFTKNNDVQGLFCGKIEINLLKKIHAQILFARKWPAAFSSF